MKGSRRVFDQKAGKFIDGKASPWLPPQHMRELPESIITKDTSDPDKIHELDPPHIVEALRDDHAAKEQSGNDVGDDHLFSGLDLYHGPLDQLHVDAIRFKAIRNLVKSALIHAHDGLPFNLRQVRHLWFTSDALSPRQLRTGNPPPTSDRPRWMKKLDLVVDVYHWPRRILDEMRRLGMPLPDVMQLEEQCRRSRVLSLQ